MLGYLIFFALYADRRKFLVSSVDTVLVSKIFLDNIVDTCLQVTIEEVVIMEEIKLRFVSQFRNNTFSLDTGPAPLLFVIDLYYAFAKLRHHWLIFSALVTLSK